MFFCPTVSKWLSSLKKLGRPVCSHRGKDEKDFECHVIQQFPNLDEHQNRQPGTCIKKTESWVSVLDLDTVRMEWYLENCTLNKSLWWYKFNSLRKRRTKAVRSKRVSRLEIRCSVLWVVAGCPEGHLGFRFRVLERACFSGLSRLTRHGLPSSFSLWKC